MNLITDVPGILVGNAQDAGLKSGVTCLSADAPFVAGVDIRGGAPGTRETDLLDPERTVAEVDALVLSGGSAFGLDAASGVVDGLHKDGRGFAVGDVRVPIVPGAILFDLLNGGDKAWGANPYRALGLAAYQERSASFDLGSCGAGTGAVTARHKGGLGSASFTLSSGAVVGALVAVNAVGDVGPSDEQAFWAGSWEQGAEFGGFGPVGHQAQVMDISDTKLAALASERANTTIGIVATDVALDKAGCKRLAVAGQDGFALAIQPAHTAFDGDLVFGVSTGRRKPADLAEQIELSHLATLVMARAIARAVFEATPSTGDLVPCWSQATGAG